MIEWIVGAALVLGGIINSGQKTDKKPTPIQKRTNEVGASDILKWREQWEPIVETRSSFEVVDNTTI